MVHPPAGGGQPTVDGVFGRLDAEASTRSNRITAASLRSGYGSKVRTHTRARARKPLSPRTPRTAEHPYCHTAHRRPPTHAPGGSPTRPPLQHYKVYLSMGDQPTCLPAQLPVFHSAEKVAHLPCSLAQTPTPPLQAAASGDAVATSPQPRCRLCQSTTMVGQQVSLRHFPAPDGGLDSRPLDCVDSGYLWTQHRFPRPVLQTLLEAARPSYAGLTGTHYGCCHKCRHTPAMLRCAILDLGGKQAAVGAAALRFVAPAQDHQGLTEFDRTIFMLHGNAEGSLGVLARYKRGKAMTVGADKVSPWRMRTMDIYNQPSTYLPDGWLHGTGLLVAEQGITGYTASQQLSAAIGGRSAMAPFLYVALERIFTVFHEYCAKSCGMVSSRQSRLTWAPQSCPASACSACNDT